MSMLFEVVSAILAYAITVSPDVLVSEVSNDPA
jgi:hypothetical protein